MMHHNTNVLQANTTFVNFLVMSVSNYCLYSKAEVLLGGANAQVPVAVGPVCFLRGYGYGMLAAGEDLFYHIFFPI